jgi:hypothetical protein
MEVDIRITGITPLICNRFYDEAAMTSSQSVRSSAAGRDRGTPQEMAEKKLYMGLNGKPMIPQPNLLRCLIDGGAFFKVGKSQVTTSTKSMLFGVFDIPVAEIEIMHEQPWTVDTRAVVIPSTKGRILTHRPMFNDWSLEFTAEIDTSVVSEKLMREIIDAAGNRIGLGDFRPAKKGPYGRFRVDYWNTVSVKQAA